jgi:stearoyl-CoA desaturase (Delta-9 desaturase)
MAWIPVTAAGIINGIGHYWGYRNFEAADASTNVSPWGILIGGEELHNNHHTYPTSAKLSVKPYEFDIGWMYIRMIKSWAWPRCARRRPSWLGEVRPVADGKTLEAIIANRYEVMAGYAANCKRACQRELDRMKAQGADSARWSRLKRQALAAPRRRQDPADMKPQLAQAWREPGAGQAGGHARGTAPLWTRTNVSAEQLVADLQAWCRKAEDSGIAALQDFSLKLRAAHA